MNEPANTLELEVWVTPIHRTRATEEHCPQFKVTEATFTFVAIDDEGRKKKISQLESD